MSVPFLLGLIVFEIVADVFAKEYSLKPAPLRGVLALSFYVAANTSWLLSLRIKSALAQGANIFSVSTGIIAAVIGVWFYGEALEPRQYAGIALGAVSLALLTL